jgi:dolichol-phosphate mannosyltransferase
VQTKTLGIIVLAFNEVESLKLTINTLIRLIPKNSKVIISTSHYASKECLAVAKELSQVNKNVETYFQQKPFVAAAVLEAVEKLNSDLIIYMSADLETPPELVPKLLKAYLKGGCNIVAGSRWIQGGSFTSYGGLKLLTSFIAQSVCRALYRWNLTEYTYGYRLYERRWLEEINYRESKHPFFLESLLLPIRNGAMVIEIPVDWTPRREGNSVVTLSTLLMYLRPVFLCRFMKVSERLKG